MLPLRRHLLHQMRDGASRYVCLQCWSCHVPHPTKANRLHRLKQDNPQPACSKLLIFERELIRSRPLAAALLPRLLPSALRLVLRFARLRVPCRWRLGLLGGLLQPHLEGARTHLHAQCMRSFSACVVHSSPKHALRTALVCRPTRESLRRAAALRH